MKTTDYSIIAKKYDANQFRIEEIKYDTHLKNYLDTNEGPKYHVLDLSCGTGLYLEKQMNNFYQYDIEWYGLDLSQEMLNHAATRTSAKLIHANAEATPFLSESFDFISNNYAFHHYCDKSQALNEIHRVLKRGGNYKLHNIDIYGMSKWWVYHYFPSTYEEDIKRYWTKESIFDELTNRGFNVYMEVKYRMHHIKVANFLTHAENRDISILTLISDQEYFDGLERMRYDIKLDPDKLIVNDFAEMICVSKKY